MTVPCEGCGTPVDVLCNPIDPSDTRPLCYECAEYPSDTCRTCGETADGCDCDGYWTAYSNSGGSRQAALAYIRGEIPMPEPKRGDANGTA